MRPLSRRGVSAVVAIILLVGITVVLTAFLYIIVSDIAQNVNEVPPRVLLTNIGNPAGQMEFQVSAVEVKPLAEFQFRLWIDGVLDPASVMNPIAAGTVGNVTFIDTDGGGGLSDGDLVIVQTSAAHEYELFLLWKGNVLDHPTWST